MIADSVLIVGLLEVCIFFPDVHLRVRKARSSEQYLSTLDNQKMAYGSGFRTGVARRGDRWCSKGTWTDMVVLVHENYLCTVSYRCHGSANFQV